MKKISILFLFFILVLAGVLLANEKTILKVNVQMANVRSQPDALAPIVAKVVAGTQLEVDGKTGAWYEVTVNDDSGKAVTGYIRDTVVEVVGADEEEAETEAEAEAKPEAKPRPVVRREVPREEFRDSSTEEVSNPMSFGINLGIRTYDDFEFDPLQWTVGVELDFQLGDYLMVSPEVMLVGYEFEFEDFLLVPSVILNFTLSNFYIGGGVSKPFYIGSGSSGSFDFALKLNAGIITKSFKLTAYTIMDFDSLFEDMSLGATLGFRF